MVHFKTPNFQNILMSTESEFVNRTCYMKETYSSIKGSTGIISQNQYRKNLSPVSHFKTIIF